MPDISLSSIRINEDKRDELLRKIINEKEWGRVLVFVGKKTTTEELAVFLRRGGMLAEGIR